MLAAISAATNNHAINILPDMSLVAGDTPGALQPPVAQRDIKAEVIYCVGGVVSPLLANLFMHYAFDTWMDREFPGCPFERYADDIIAHCDTEDQARQLLAAIAARLGALVRQPHLVL